MPYSIRSLLSGPQEADTTLARRRQQLGELITPRGMEAVAPATADSIFRVLGDPANPIQAHQPQSGLAVFDERERQISFDPYYVASELARERNPAVRQILGPRPPVDETLAHEMAHEATVREDRELVSQDPDVQGFLNLFLDQYESLGEEGQRDLFSVYLRGTPLEGRLPSTHRLEVVADALERGFSLARRANPDDPSEGREERQQIFDQLPGTREAFNFWMRRLMQEFPNEDN
jgi:hypothetical protein